MKKITAILLMLALVLSLVACGDKKPTSTPTTAATEAPTATPTEEPTPTPEADDPAKKSEGVMTYAEYIAAADEDEVVLECYVQDHQSWWDNKITVYCQDPDGAYFLYEL